MKTFCPHCEATTNCHLYLDRSRPGAEPFPDNLVPTLALCDVTFWKCEICSREFGAIPPSNRDTARLDWFEKAAQHGLAPFLCYDDGDFWAISCDGGGPIPQDEGPHTEPVDFVSCVFPEDWKPSPREAIDHAIQQHPLDADDYEKN